MSFIALQFLHLCHFCVLAYHLEGELLWAKPDTGLDWGQLLDWKTLVPAFKERNGKVYSWPEHGRAVESQELDSPVLGPRAKQLLLRAPEDSRHNVHISFIIPYLDHQRSPAWPPELLCLLQAFRINHCSQGDLIMFLWPILKFLRFLTALWVKSPGLNGV